jgi:hypothetical protein
MPKEYLPIDEKTWQETGSKFVSAAGKYLAKMQMPKWKAAGKSYEFPFVLTAEGEAGKEGSGFASINRFALEPFFRSCNVKFEFENGKLAFDKADFVNKVFLAVYTDQPDTRTDAEGGTGKTFVKFDHPEAVEAKSQELA